MADAFFQTGAVQALIKTLLPGVAQSRSDQRVGVLVKLLSSLLNHSSDFDQECQLSIGSDGPLLLSALKDLAKRPADQSTQDFVLAILYKFAFEFELSAPDQTPDGVGECVQLDSNGLQQLSVPNRQRIELTKLQLPMQMLKRLLGNERIRNLRDLPSYSIRVEEQIQNWDNSLDQHEKRVETIQNALSEYESGFNFVGLHKGFDELSKEKQGELKKVRKNVTLLGIATLAPACIEVIFILWNLEKVTQLAIPLLATALPVLSLTAILVYFFRLSVRSQDSLKSQLLQIKLRMTLCRFVESYAGFANRMQTENKETLTKFESIIFSSIVGSDEKMPATFDGLDQLASLIKSVKP